MDGWMDGWIDGWEKMRRQCPSDSERPTRDQAKIGKAKRGGESQCPPSQDTEKEKGVDDRTGPW